MNRNIKRFFIFLGCFVVMLSGRTFAKLYPDGVDTESCIVKSFYHTYEDRISITLVCTDKQGAILMGIRSDRTINYAMSYITTDGGYGLIDNGEMFPLPRACFILPGVSNPENRAAFTSFSFTIHKPNDFLRVDEIVHSITIIQASSMSEITVNDISDVTNRKEHFYISSSNWDIPESQSQDAKEANETE